MDQLPERQSAKMHIEEMDNLSRPLYVKETESIINGFLKQKAPGSDGFTGEVYQTFKEEIIPIFIISSRRQKRGNTS